MDFDRYTIALLLLRADAPRLTEEEEAELQDAHMAHLADLHDAGYLLASGPVLGADDRELRGFSILSVSIWIVHANSKSKIRPFGVADSASRCFPGYSQPAS